MSKYLEFIESILSTRPNVKFQGSERHHIKPRCLGGTWDDGWVYLTPREHFIAHQLLIEEYPDEPKLKYALMRMANDNKHCTPEEYEEVRIVYIQSITGSGHPMYGKKLSDSTRRKLSLSHKGIKPSKKTIEALITRSIGNKYFEGKKHTETWKSNCSDWMKGRKQVLGRVWIHLGSASKMIELSDLPNYEELGWSRGRGVVHNKDARNKISNITSKRFWITNGNVTKFVTSEEYDKLDKFIWKKGRRTDGGVNLS